MKKTSRVVLAFFLIVLVGISWLIALTQKSDTEKQEELLKQANAYLEDEVYVLAIPLLEQAVDYHTKRTVEIEDILKSAYRPLLDQSEYQRKYIGLLEKEMARDDVQAGTFREAANYYFSLNKPTEALKILRNGLDKTDDDELRDEYERQRYGYRIGYNTYEDVGTVYNGAIRVANNGKWGLASADGTLVLPCQYDKISNYLDQRVIVRQGETVCAIDMNGNRLALLKEESESFDYSGKDVVMLKLKDGWHITSKDFKKVCRAAFEELRILSNKCAAAKVDGKWGLVKPSYDLRETDDSSSERQPLESYGEWLIQPEHDEVIVDDLGIAYAQKAVFIRDGNVVTMLADQGKTFEKIGDAYEDAKPFGSNSGDGYAAVKQNGKWGFVDTSGKLVIECQFEDALSFGQHLAAVKVDGKWGYIDLQGNIVIPCEFEEVRSFYKGSAAVKTERGWIFLILEEYA